MKFNFAANIMFWKYWECSVGYQLPPNLGPCMVEVAQLTGFYAKFKRFQN